MKKLLCAILSGIMAFSTFAVAVPITASAAESQASVSATYGDFEYTLEDDYTCTITGYNGSATNVTIPSTIYGNKVSAIGRYAFEENPNIKKVAMPNSVKIIDRGAFWYCGNLESVTMPTSLKEIGGCAFYETNLKSVVLPTGLKYISDGAFRFCYNLKTVTLPNTVESLGDACFGSCTSLQSISIPNSVKDMQWSTFDRCTSLKTVTIGCGVDTMNAYSVFGGCTSLESITVSSSNNNYSSANGIMYDKKKTEIIVYPHGKKDTTYSVPSSVKSLGEMSANGNAYLKTVTIPSVVKDISDYAFGYIGEQYNYKKVSGFTIKGYKGTAAERYARNNDFNFVELKLLSTPSIKTLANTAGGIKLSWNKVNGAYGYRVYVKTSSGWKKLKDTTATSYTDSAVTANQTKTYTIRCIDKNGNTVSNFNSKGWTKKYSPVAPTIGKLENTTGGIKLTWNKITGVYGYRVYVKTSSGWKKLKDTTATSLTDSAVTANQTKTYTIRCIDKSGKTISNYNTRGWSKKYTAAVPKITKLTNTSKGVSVTWNKIAGVYGYRVYRKYAGGSWTKVKDTTATSLTDSGAKKGKKVTYTVRCIDKKGNTVSGYNATGWSITRK